MHDDLDLLTRFLVDQYAFPVEDVFHLSKFKKVEARRNQLLLSSGEICRHVYFICKGCVRTYFIDKAGLEKTRFLAFENNFVTSFASFITQTPSAQYVQSLEAVTLLRIGHRDFYKLVDNNPVFAKLYRHSLEQSVVFSTWRIETMISMTAKERYQDLLERMPEIILRLSNKQVASFLGITQESLSRLKR